MVPVWFWNFSWNSMILKGIPKLLLEFYNCNHIEKPDDFLFAFLAITLLKSCAR